MMVFAWVYKGSELYYILYTIYIYYIYIYTHYKYYIYIRYIYYIYYIYYIGDHGISLEPEPSPRSPSDGTGFDRAAD